jgi:hypothetical protein
MFLANLTHSHALHHFYLFILFMWMFLMLFHPLATSLLFIYRIRRAHINMKRESFLSFRKIITYKSTVIVIPFVRNIIGANKSAIFQTIIRWISHPLIYFHFSFWFASLCVFLCLFALTKLQQVEIEKINVWMSFNIHSFFPNLVDSFCVCVCGLSE